ncbi:MAG: helix-turn-helix domain-containing protein [Bacteroidota bacterium]
MQKHRGEIVEDAVRKSGFSLKKLSERLKISRNTLYNRFREPELSYEFIRAVGDIIHYNFSIDFAELQEEIDEMGESPMSYTDQDTAELLRLEKKYTGLLERYNKLLSILARCAHASELQTLRKEIFRFLENDSV